MHLKFFTRCKILYGFLALFCVCTGIILFLRLFPRMTPHFWYFWDYFFICLFLFWIVCLVILKCIILDAEEDLAAIMRLNDGSETQLGRGES